MAHKEGAVVQMQSSINYKGLRLATAPGVIEGRIKAAIDSGWYEAPEAKHIPHILQQGERVLELGSGLGYLTSVLAKDPRVTEVVSFEANPQLAAVARRTLELNGVSGKAQVRNAVAVPNPTTSKIPFYIRDEFWASSMDGEPWGYREVIYVPAVDINAEIARLKPTLMVVDIEGGEQHLFREIELGSVLKVLLELHQQAIGRQGVLSVFEQMAIRKFHYDQWHSEHAIVTFSRVDRDEVAVMEGTYSE